MLKKVLNTVFTNKFLKYLFSFLFLNKYFIGIFNYVYEFSPHIFQELFVRLSNTPDFSFYWTIYLPNKKKVKVYVDRNNKYSFAFAISYKWHDLGVRQRETLLNSYYRMDYCYIDIGANHGLRSVYSLSQGRYSYLFEPNKFLNNFILNFFQLNSFKKFSLENLCLSDKRGTLNFYISPSSFLSSLDKSNAMSDTDKGEVTEVKVEVTTIDEYFKALDVKPGIIKIDVEGHEYEVLKGASQLLKKFNPDLIVEILSDHGKKKEIYRFLEGLSYKCYAIKNKEKLTLIKYYDEHDFVNTHLANNYLFTINEKPLSGITFN
ncbi:MAG: FkbM family methyltransferase [Ignavibacteria bacterium]|nr:FkbM family methyltransferase [Ignavibacteria bacterium]